MTSQLAEQQCSNKLCKAEATQAITVGDAWKANIFRGRKIKPDLYYQLCDACYAKYLPRGEGYLSREQSVRLRVQCKGELA